MMTLVVPSHLPSTITVVTCLIELRSICFFFLETKYQPDGTFIPLGYNRLFVIIFRIRLVESITSSFRTRCGFSPIFTEPSART
jgi:hypothetical protein